MRAMEGGGLGGGCTEWFPRLPSPVIATPTALTAEFTRFPFGPVVIACSRPMNAVLESISFSLPGDDNGLVGEEGGGGVPSTPHT